MPSCLSIAHDFMTLNENIDYVKSPNEKVLFSKHELQESLIEHPGRNQITKINFRRVMRAAKSAPPTRVVGGAVGQCVAPHKL